MSLCCIFSNVTDVQEVYWVHWLWARATFHRWEEELALTQNEMHWVTNYFTFWQKQWIGWAPVAHGGHLAYAKRQSAMWSEQCHDTIWLQVCSYWSVWGCMGWHHAHPLISFFLSWGYRFLMAQIAVHRAIWITHAINSIFLLQPSQGLSLWESSAPTACLLFSSFFCCTGSEYWFTCAPGNFGPATQISIGGRP